MFVTVLLFYSIAEKNITHVPVTVTHESIVSIEMNKDYLLEISYYNFLT